MKYLFDTDALSLLMRPAPPVGLVRRFAMTPPEDQNTSSITVGELYYGARRKASGGETLVRQIEDRLLPNLTILSFDADAARIYGWLRAELERRGTPIGDADTRIASIALVHGLIIVTGNVRHFSRVAGLTIENWIETETSSNT